MLKFSSGTLESFNEVDRNRFVEKIDPWMAQESMSYANSPLDERKSELREMVKFAEQCKMLTERDFALFSLACWSFGKNWNKWVMAEETAQILSTPDFNVDSKLLHLDDLLIASEPRQ